MKPTTTPPTTPAPTAPAVDPAALAAHHLRESCRVKERMAAERAGEIAAAARALADAVRAGRKVLFCGNGGSAADAQHLAAELVVRLTSAFERGPVAALALTTDSSLLTACANDYGYDVVFSRQVEALGQPGDVLVGITTSGRSKSVLLALEAAKRKGVVRLLLSAGDGGPCAAHADLAVLVPSKDTAHIQECHIAIGHVLCELVERLALGRG